MAAMLHVLQPSCENPNELYTVGCLTACHCVHVDIIYLEWMHLYSSKVFHLKLYSKETCLLKEACTGYKVLDETEINTPWLTTGFDLLTFCDLKEIRIS